MSNDDENQIVKKIIEPLKTTTSGILSWIYTEEGKIITRVVGSLGSFVGGDPTGLLFPTILECTDYGIRKRFLKHFPDLVDKLEKEKLILNMNFVKSEIGQQLLRETFKAFTKETNDEKLESHKAFLINSYKMQNPDEVVLNRCLKILNNLEPTQLQILKILYQPREAVECIFIKNKHNRGDRTDVDILGELNLYVETDMDVYRNSLAKLHSEGLISVVNESNGPKGGYGDNDWQTGIGTMTNATHDLVTRFGKKFIKLIIKS